MFQSVFPIVVFGAVALSIVVSLVFLLSRGSAYDQIGDEGFTTESDHAAHAYPAPLDYASSRAEQELEIRQMLIARNERLRGRGEPAIDVDAELQRLLAPERPSGHDPGLALEVRQLVLARNERRGRSGLEPLDVEAEVQRTLAELDP